MKNKKTAILFSKVLLLSATLFVFASCSKNNSSPATVSNLTATLNGSQETPANATAGTGNLTATYNSGTKAMSYTLTWTGLTGNPTAMHFHKGDVGVAGDVEIPITGFAAATAGTLTATATVADSLTSDLLEGKFYVNIHTAANPAGEIRGQVLKY